MNDNGKLIGYLVDGHLLLTVQMYKELQAYYESRNLPPLVGQPVYEPTVH